MESPPRKRQRLSSPEFDDDYGSLDAEAFAQLDELERSFSQPATKKPVSQAAPQKLARQNAIAEALRELNRTPSYQ